MLGALAPFGPRPPLIFTGEQGSAKTSNSRVTAGLLSPSEVRALPRTEQDLAIALKHNYLPVLDNLSSLPAQMSDALCRAATGGALATRELYTNGEEFVITVRRSCILNGIGDVAVRADLLDRALIVECPTIKDEDRRDEATLGAQLLEAQPRILGALLDSVSVGLRRLPETRLANAPRMADFARWVTACEPGLGWEPETFLKAYQGNRDEAVLVGLEHSPIARALISLLEEDGSWQGSAGVLLEALVGFTTESERRVPGYPTDAARLGKALMRIAPALRRLGYGVEQVKGTKGVRIITLSRPPSPRSGWQ